jgi:hypothetical protein
MTFRGCPRQGQKASSGSTVGPWSRNPLTGARP